MLYSLLIYSSYTKSFEANNFIKLSAILDNLCEVYIASYYNSCSITEKLANGSMCCMRELF